MDTDGILVYTFPGRSVGDSWLAATVCSRSRVQGGMVEFQAEIAVRCLLLSAEL
jgi:hypothetical protein